MSLLELFTIMYIHFYLVSSQSQKSCGGQQSNLEQDQIPFSPLLTSLGPGYFPYLKFFVCLLVLFCHLKNVSFPPFIGWVLIN